MKSRRLRCIAFNIREASGFFHAARLNCAYGTRVPAVSQPACRVADEIADREGFIVAWRAMQWSPLYRLEAEASDLITPPLRRLSLR
jgi:hypothetical protein